MDTMRNIDVMGIINLTDNSYFSESRCLGKDGRDDIGKIVERATRMAGEGASILDIGACSTRPGSNPVGEEEEWRRLEPALKAIRQELPGIRISIDTYWPSVVRKTFDLIGDFIVNDVTAGEGMEGDAGYRKGEMLPLVGRLGLTYVAMHMRGNPATMQTLTSYEDITAEVLGYFNDFALKAGQAGIRNWILDPGFGFAKTVEQNYKLLADLGKFIATGRRVLVGVSRKSMVYRKFGITPEEALPATQVLHYKALCCGADILRVHDVAEAARTVEIYRMLEITQS
ncbi:MAG: dihydropteroate synthase [Candidatus Cryptobacteroides sp.]